MYVKEKYSKLKLAIAWYQKKYASDLLCEWFQCEWADAVLKAGNTLYTNVLYWKALNDFSEIADFVGNREDNKYFAKISVNIKQKIINKFWNGKFMADWIDWRRHDFFASHQNMLAIFFGLLDNNKTQSILRFAKEYCWNIFTLETNYPRYPIWRIPLLNLLTGMHNYHNRGCLWLQPGILYALCLNKFGDKKESILVFEKISQQIAKFGQIYEVYDKNGQPLKRLLYTSEYPFAWSAGLYLYTHHILFKR